MATIDCNVAIGDIASMQLAGHSACAAGRAMPVVELIGDRLRGSLMEQWAVSEVTYQRIVRVLTAPPGVRS